MDKRQFMDRKEIDMAHRQMVDYTGKMENTMLEQSV